MSKASKVKRAIVHLFCILYIVVTMFPLFVDGNQRL